MTNPDTGSLTARALAEIRAELGRQDITRRDLANRLGVERMWVYNRLSGETPLRISDVEQIAAALGVPVHQLIPAPAPEPAPDGAR